MHCRQQDYGNMGRRNDGIAFKIYKVKKSNANMIPLIYPFNRSGRKYLQ